MATFKHISSKNADYGAAEVCLLFTHDETHDEFTRKPILDKFGLLERKRVGLSAAKHLYVKLPPVVRLSDPGMDGETSPISLENRPAGEGKSDLMTVRNLSFNSLIRNNRIGSQTIGVREKPHKAFGRYENVFLTDAEYAELQTDFPDRLKRFIEEMSRYLAATGRKYQNYAALRIWAENDKKGALKQRVPDYTCKEGESLWKPNWKL